MNLKKKKISRRKKEIEKVKVIASCRYEENIIAMLRENFYTNSLSPKKIDAENFEIHGYDGLVEQIQVRFNKKADKFQLIQIINSEL